MRGEVLYYDETQGFGFIQAVDGKRYAFARENLRRQAAMAKGTIVEFQPSGSDARDIFTLRAQIGGWTPEIGASAAVAGTSAPSSLPQPAALPVTSVPFGRQADGYTGAAPSTGLWSYFWRALTSNYVNFSGRARRKEYWSYALFWLIFFSILCCVAITVDGEAGNLGQGAGIPIVTIVAAGLFILATFLPGLGLTIRRIHDIGLSGWFYLLILIPSVGGLIILVFCLISTQRHENKWGPVPPGIAT